MPSSACPSTTTTSASTRSAIATSCSSTSGTATSPPTSATSSPRPTPSNSPSPPRPAPLDAPPEALHDRGAEAPGGRRALHQEARQEDHAVTLTQQLTDYVRAAFAGLWVQTHEPDEAEREIADLCQQHDWQLKSWD